MKTTLAAVLVSFAVACAPAAWAQGSADATELKSLLEQTKTPEGKRALVASTLGLTDAEAKKFWPVYDAYQRKLDAANRQYSRAIEDVVMSGRPVSDAYAKNLTKEVIEVEDAALERRFQPVMVDEPSVGLMPKLVDFVYGEIAKLKQEQFTILVVDQNVKKSIEIADYVYVLNLGENSHHGPQHEFARRLEDIIREWL